MVVAAEERADVVDRGGEQVVGRPDRGPVIRVLVRKQGGHQREPGHAVRAVLVVLPPFVQHDVALVGELLLGEGRQQEPHAIGFHPQRQLEGVGRHDLPVVRAIGIGGAVQRAAGLLEGFEVPRVVMGRALEHQVLEQVREPRPARDLVLRAHVVPDVDGGDRARVVFVDDHLQSVVEDVFPERDVEFWCRHGDWLQRILTALVHRTGKQVAW